MNTPETNGPDFEKSPAHDSSSGLIYRYLIVATIVISTLVGAYFYRDDLSACLFVWIPHFVSFVLAFIVRTRQAGVVILICSILYSIWGAFVLSFIPGAGEWLGMVFFMGLALASPILFLMWGYACAVEVRLRFKTDSGSGDAESS